MSRYSKYARSFSLLPNFFTEPDGYVEAVVDAMRRNGAQVLLPGHDDVGVFAQRRGRLPEWLRVALPPLASYERANNKRTVIEYAHTLGLPTPRATTVVRESDLSTVAAVLGWPVVVKTHVGNSAKGVRIARDLTELESSFLGLIHEFNLAPHHWPFIEEFLPGRACGVCVLCDRGRVVTSFAEEYLRCKDGTLFGTSTFRRTMPDEHKVVQIASFLMEGLQWHGLAHCDFIADRNGEFRIIEVNPRPWGAIWLSVVAGIDFPHLWYALANGDDLVSLSPRASRADVTCRWILGDMAGIGCMLARGQLGAAVRSLAPQRGTAHDDWSWDDPLPFGFECIDYLFRSLRARGLNGALPGMVR